MTSQSRNTLDRTSASADISLAEATTTEDIDHARRLFRAYAEEFAGTIAAILCLQGFERETAGLPGRYGPPSGCLLLARDGSLAAGCVAMRDLGGGVCEMKRLYVVPGCRGRGISRMLVTELLARASRKGYERMVLDTRPEMTAAITLYRSLGFVKTAPYGETPVDRTVYLEKRLGSR